MNWSGAMTSTAAMLIGWAILSLIVVGSCYASAGLGVMTEEKIAIDWRSCSTPNVGWSIASVAGFFGLALHGWRGRHRPELL